MQNRVTPQVKLGLLQTYIMQKEVIEFWSAPPQSAVVCVCDLLQFSFTVKNSTSEREHLSTTHWQALPTRPLKRCHSQLLKRDFFNGNIKFNTGCIQADARTRLKGEASRIESLDNGDILSPMNVQDDLPDCNNAQRGAWLAMPTLKQEG